MSQYIVNLQYKFSFWAVFFDNFRSVFSYFYQNAHTIQLFMQYMRNFRLPFLMLFIAEASSFI